MSILGAKACLGTLLGAKDPTCGLDGGSKKCCTKPESDGLRGSTDERENFSLVASATTDKSKQKLATSIERVPSAFPGHTSNLVMSVRACFGEGDVASIAADRITPPPGGVCADAESFGRFYVLEVCFRVIYISWCI